jgi:hypothetical protein
MRRSLLLIGMSLALLCFSVPANAELDREGKLVVSFGGGLAPTRLPRTTPAPVAITFGGGVKAVEGAPIPQLRTIRVAINRSGQLFDSGLPTCRVRAIQPATEAEARAVCGGAIVGSGQVTVEARLGSQEPFSVDANLLAFNGPTVGGQKLILAQVYSNNPPGAFVLTFKVERGPGLFGTVLSTSLPKTAQGWAYLTHFEMTLKRQYRFRGQKRSFVSAACGAPAGFPGAIFPFAKASYGFSNGQTLRTTIVRSCKVRGA